MLRIVFNELRKTASIDITPNDSEFEVELAYKTPEDILAFVDMVYSGGRSIDWKMRLRNEVYKSQITSEELTEKMLHILRCIRVDKHNHKDYPRLMLYLSRIAKRKGVSGTLIDSIQESAMEDLHDTWTCFNDIKHRIYWEIGRAHV